MPEKEKVLLVHFDEILIKGRNQYLFIQRVFNHLREVLKGQFAFYLKEIFDQGTMIFFLPEDLGLEALARIGKIPGVHSFYVGHQIPLSIEKIEAEIAEQLLQLQESKDSVAVTSFKIQVRRTDKSFPYQSMQLERMLGGVVLERRPNWKVQLKDPQVTFYVRLMSGYALVASKRHVGIGGLSAGSSGRALTLLSGGFDSAVASYLLSRRGLEQDFIFFHSSPFVGSKVKFQVMDVAKELSAYQRKANFFIIPFGEIHQKIIDKIPHSYRTLFFRYAMVTVAAKISSRYEALIMGDSLGQVASQTIGNLRLIEEWSSLPLMRPLLAFNKSEITDLARKMGIFDLCAASCDDACSAFHAPHPVTNPAVKLCRHLKEDFCIEEEQKRAVEAMERVVYRYGELQI